MRLVSTSKLVLAKKNVLTVVPTIVFVLISLLCVSYFLHYVYLILTFPFDWEPTDGDHLNFAHRLFQGLPIYLSMGKGEVLSIYNPLYHGIVAFFGGGDSSLSFARSVSFCFWISCPLLLIAYFKRTWGLFYVVIASLFLLLPPQPGMLIDIVHVSPNSTMAFLFFGSLLFADFCAENIKSGFLKWIVLGSISGLCFLTKQQGLIAFLSVSIFLLAKPRRLFNLTLVGLGFLTVVICATLYLQKMNSGEFLNATLFDLNKIMVTDQLLAFRRLLSFLSYQFYFIAGAFLSFIVCGSIRSKISIWQISFILHFPFLLLVLGNAGGGENYFLTFWILTVVICANAASQLAKSKSEFGPFGPIWFAALGIIPSLGIISLGLRGQFAIFWIGGLLCVLLACDISGPLKPWRRFLQNIKKELNKPTMFANIFVVCLFANGSVGALRSYDNFKHINMPTDELYQLMQTYYETVSSLLKAKPDAKVLAGRNIGALVAAHAEVRNEGSTMFAYAWPFPKIFAKDIVLSKVNKKEYDIITTGMQGFPSELAEAISQNYKITFSGKTNLIMGETKITTIYIPK